MKLLMFITILSLPLLTNAKLFSITGCTTLQSVCDTLETEINNKLPATTNINELSNGMVNASLISTKGIGADYASNMSVFAFGGGVSLGFSNASLSKVSSQSGTTPGIGVASGFLMGIRLGFLKSSFFQRSRLFVNFGNLHPPASYNIGGTFSTFGTHLQYHLLDSANIGFGLFNFGGVDITLGFESNTSKLQLKSDLTTTLAANQTMTGTAVISTNTKTYSIPLEISTNIRFLYFLTLYGGFGIERNWGDNTTTIGLENATLSVGTANLNLTGTSTAQAFTFRDFIGLQANILPIKIFVQVNNGINASLLNIHFGARLVW